MPSALALLAVGELGLGRVARASSRRCLAPSRSGGPLGRRAFLRLDAERFRRAGLVLAVLAGVASTMVGLAG